MVRSILLWCGTSGTLGRCARSVSRLGRTMPWKSASGTSKACAKNARPMMSKFTRRNGKKIFIARYVGTSTSATCGKLEEETCRTLRFFFYLAVTKFILELRARKASKAKQRKQSKQRKASNRLRSCKAEFRFSDRTGPIRQNRNVPRRYVSHSHFDSLLD